MGKGWDYKVPSVAQFVEILRVLRPGGTMLCFAGSRTQHRMAINVEDAGFFLKDCIMWLYGSGFPKATDISKQIDKAAGAEREVVGKKQGDRYKYEFKHGFDSHDENSKFGAGDASTITAPATAEAKVWDGWKSHGLKPAYEPILVAMKANEGSYANNALTHGVAGLNIDAGRIEFQSDADKESAVFGRGTDILGGNYVGATHSTGETNIPPDDKGRFPANVILDEQAAKMLDEQSGESVSTGGRIGKKAKSNIDFGLSGKYEKGDPGFNDSGGASRFFYCAKASKSERNEGCEQFFWRKDPQRPSGVVEVTESEWLHLPEEDRARGNVHPTIKPLDHMEYLCKLTSTPTGGIVLDPFAGSGTTCLAAYNTGRDYIGIERDPDYIKIIEARLTAAKQKLGLFES